MKKKRILAVLMSAILALGVFGGCGEKKDDGKVSISIGNWPAKGQAGYDIYMKDLETFRAAHPDIDIQPDTYAYDTKNFVAKAAAGQLPTTYDTYFTEVKQIANQGYAADISAALKKTGLIDKLNPQSLEVVKGENGEIWGVPHHAYAQGLTINKKLFKEAGLVNEDGSIKVPNTYAEVAEYAKIINEKTGKAGFVIPTIDNCGGWHMMNVAWSYGTEFMKQDGGKWKATFDSAEFKAACQWLYDMKWKHNALPANSNVSNGDRAQIFATYQAAMMFAAPPEHDLVSKYGMAIEDIACVRIPEGPKGRYAQTGGAVWMFSNKATDAEIEAALLWLVEHGGFATTVTEEVVASTEENLKMSIEAGRISLPRDSMPTLVNREGEEKMTALREKYSNVDMKDYEIYFGFEEVVLKPEEPVCCQQLYSVLDGVVQKIITDENVDIAAVVKTAAQDFQKNHLDNL